MKKEFGNQGTDLIFFFCKCVKTVVLDCVSYSVSSGRQRSPLDGRPAVTAVVPQDDLSRVSPAHNQVGMKPGEAHRYHWRLQDEGRG